MGFGEAEAAETAYRAALAAMPGMREAAYQLHVKLRGPAFAEGMSDQPTDYEKALARIEIERVRTERDVTTPDRPYALEGLEAARGLLLYRKGDFLQASEVLAPLAKRYPQDALLRLTREHATAQGIRAALALCLGLDHQEITALELGWRKTGAALLEVVGDPCHVIGCELLAQILVKQIERFLTFRLGHQRALAGLRYPISTA